MKYDDCMIVNSGRADEFYDRLVCNNLAVDGIVTINPVLLNSVPKS